MYIQVTEIFIAWEKTGFQSKYREKEALHCEHSEVSHLLTSPKTANSMAESKQKTKKENKKARVSINN